MADSPEEIVDAALSVLDEHLHLSEVEGPSTHIAIHPRALEDESVPEALGRYFVGLVAGIVQEDVSLGEELLAIEPDSAAEVRLQINKTIGRDNNFPNKRRRHFRDRVRNPYIAEVMAHALMVLRSRGDTACLLGPPVALKNPHADPRKQGMDLIGIYDGGGLPAAVIGEAKASRKYGPRRLKEAAKFFADIEAGKRGVEIRTELGSLKLALDRDMRRGIGDGFWRQRCAYVPIIAFEEPIDETKDNGDLDGLRPDPADIRLIALEISPFYSFFDQVADQIRRATEELLA